MKKIIALALAVMMALSLVCVASAEKTTYKVGIVQYVSDASLDQISNNIKAELARSSTNCPPPATLKK